MTFFRHSQRLRSFVLLTVSLLFFAGAAQTASVTITSPKQKAVLHGRLQVIALPSADAQYTYAVLVVDTTGRSMTNTLPLRFDLDTTALGNGTHTLRVDLCDSLGVVTSSKVIPVMVANPSLAVCHLPKPVPAQTKPIQLASAAPTGVQVTSSAAASTPVPVVAPTAPQVSPLVPVKINGHPVLLDGKPLVFCLDPFVLDGRTMVQLRGLVNAAGGSLAWDAAKKQGVAQVENRQLVVTLNEQTALLNGEAVQLEATICEVNGRIFVPIRAWEQLLGGSVHYDAQYHAVLLRSHAALVRAKLAE